MITDEFQALYADRFTVNMVFHHLEFLIDKDGEEYVRCNMGWSEAVETDLVETLLLNMGTLLDCAIWFYDDPYKGSKPFDIQCIGLQQDGSLSVYVLGKKSDRIKKKWGPKLAMVLGHPVELHWVKKKLGGK